MIKDLSLALIKMLEDGGIKPLIVLNRPILQSQSQDERVSLFLYDIRENVELRNNESIVERQNGQTISHPPPKRILCSYLVTAWPNHPDLQDGLYKEQELLSQVLEIFSRYSTIPESALVNDSSLKKQVYPIPIVTAHADTLRNLGEFWTAMGGQLRASISVTATLSLPALDDVTAPMVTTLRGDFEVAGGEGREFWLQIGGRVLDSARKGVPSALVDVLQPNSQQVISRVNSDEEGYFVLSHMSDGTYTIRVSAVGYEPKNQPLKVPGNSENYEIHLTALAPTLGS